MADPQYGKQSAYKLMGPHTNLIPMTPHWVVPDLRLITGLVLLILFFAIGWIRAELRIAITTSQPHGLLFNPMPNMPVLLFFALLIAYLSFLVCSPRSSASSR